MCVQSLFSPRFPVISVTLSSLIVILCELYQSSVNILLTAFWKILTQLIKPEADFLFLVWLVLGDDFIDDFRVKLALLRKLFHLDCLCKRGCFILKLYRFKQVLLLLFGQIRQLNTNTKGNAFLIHQLQELRYQLCQPNISLYLSAAVRFGYVIP